MQLFLDSSSGVPDLHDGSHEIDVNVVNGEFAGARIKKFHPGTKVASALSGTSDIHGLDHKSVPSDLWKVVKEIDKELSKWNPRIYRADFMMSQGKYMLVELNSRPGVMHSSKEGENYWDFNGRIVEMFAEMLK